MVHKADIVQHPSDELLGRNQKNAGGAEIGKKL